MTLISFTIDGTTYQAEEGMTWGEWVESDYNTDGYIVDGTYIFNATKSKGVTATGTPMPSGATIMGDFQYNTEPL